MKITKETIYECIALLNTAKYDTYSLNQKRDEVVNSLKKQLSINGVMQAKPEKCEHINYQMDSDGFDICDDCGKTLF